jgi:RNase P subunit RPR2
MHSDEKKTELIICGKCKSVLGWVDENRVAHFGMVNAIHFQGTCATCGEGFHYHISDYYLKQILERKTAPAT